MNVGTIGTSVITERMIDALKQTSNPVIAIHSRSEEKGADFARKHGVEKVYTDLDQMLADPEIDTIYVASPNAVHYGQAKKALEAGKHVICEKPFVSRREEAEDLFATAEKNGVYIFEAITTLHLPNYRILKDALAKIGTPRIVTVNFSQFSSRYEDYKQGHITPVFDPAFDGGALTDIGVYDLHFTAGLFGRPETARYFANRGPNGVDIDGTAFLTYPGMQAVLICAKDCSAPNRATIQGEQGTLMVDSSPGRVLNVSMLPVKGDMIGKKDEDQSAQIGIEQNPNHMVYEAQDFAAIIAQRDDQAYRDLRDETLLVMDLLAACRQPQPEA